MTKAKRISLSMLLACVMLAVAMIVSAFVLNAPASAKAEEADAFTVSTYDMDRTEGVDLTSPLISDYVFYGEYWGKAVYRKPGVENSGIVETRAFDVQEKLYDNLPFNAHDVKNHRGGTYSNKQGDQWNHEVTVSGKGKILFYANGYDGGRVGECVLTVTDQDGNSKQVTIGAQYNWYSRVEIEYDEETTDTYTLIFEKVHGNGSIAAVAIQPDLGLDYGFTAQRGSTEKFADLQAVGNQDWLHYNTGDTYEKRAIRKNIDASERMISDIVGTDAGWSMYWDHKATFYYGNGISGSEPIANVSTWSSALTKGTLSFDVKANAETEYINVYYSSWRNAVDVTVKDGDKVIYHNWDLWAPSDAGSGQGRCMTYYVDIPEGQEKTFTFEIKNGVEADGTNVAVAAVAVGYDDPTEAKVHVSGGDVADYNGGDDLTAVGTKDWFHFGSNTNNGKSGATYFGTVYGSDIIGHSGVNEYKTFSWTDGDNTATATDIKTISPCKNGSQTSLDLKAGEAVTLKLYIGLSQAKGNLRITDANGNILVDKSDLEAGDATFKTVTYTLCSGVDQTVRISLLTRERTNDGSGVVYLVAGALSDATVNHAWNDGEITKETTCYEEGETTYTCTECTFTKTEPIETIEHVFDKKVESDEYFDSAATCAKKATYFYSCYCGEKGTELFEVGDFAGEHVYVENPSAIYIADPANCQHVGVYYKSCTNCGLRGTETFEYGELGACEYEVKVVSTANLATPATCTSPATYYYTCECGLVSADKTFAHGATASHDFTAEVAEEATLANGLICSETAEYYYTCADCGAMGDETFVAGYSVGEHTFNKKVVNDDTLASKETCTEYAYYNYSCVCGAIGEETFVYGKLAAHDYSAKNANADTLVSEATCTEQAVYYLTCANCGATGNKDYTFKSGNTAAHTYDVESATEETKATDATCTAKATYYKTCKCGAVGTETFEYGEMLAHKYVNVAEEEYKLSDATCTEKATYAKSCKDCGAAGEATFEYGELLAHVFDQEVVAEANKATDATCTAKATYYKTCLCGAKGTETFEDGEMLAHVYDNKIAKEEYLIMAATCTEYAYYYNSCDCGAFDSSNKGNDNIFTVGTLAPHVFMEVENAMYLRNEATCTLRKTYFKSCSCGAASTYETFEVGEVGDHTWDKGIETRPATSEMEGVTTFTCTSCGETKTESIDKLASSEIDYSGGCGTVMPVSNNNDHTGGIAMMIMSAFGLAAVMFVRKKRAK